jgi:hypothetical protein
MPPDALRLAAVKLVDQLTPHTPGDTVQHVARLGAHTSQRHRSLATLGDRGGQ